MGMMKTLSRVFHRNGGGGGTRNGRHSRTDFDAEAFALRTGLGQLTPEQAVEVQSTFANGVLASPDVHADLDDGDHDDGGGGKGNGNAPGALAPPPPTPRNKQELIAELTQNYREVLSLVRKVDDHLDRQDQRSERLLELAEQLPAAADTLEQIRKRNVELNVSVRDLIAAVNDSAGKAGTNAEEHLKSLGQIQAQLEQAGKSEERTAAAFNEFRASVKTIAGSNTNLAGVLERMNQRDLGRDLRLQDMIARTQRWTIILVLLSGAGVAAAVTAVLIVTL